MDRSRGTLGPDAPSLRRERERWRNARRTRPARIETPGPGQESVWDYPRPPAVERVQRRIRVEFAGLVLADSTRALRVIETSSPPVYYLPAADVATAHLEPAPRTALCEWKGTSRYWSARVGARFAPEAAWSYPDPWEGYRAIADHFAFFAAKMDACWVDQQRVTPQPGSYYGGWITPDVVGPFKGPQGTEDW